MWEINLRVPSGVLLVLDVNAFNLSSPCDHFLQASENRLLGSESIWLKQNINLDLEQCFNF